MQFLRQVQAYYRDEYPAVMLADIVRIIPGDREVLSALYQILIRRNPAKYRTVPDVAAFEESMRELYDAYPEYRQGVRYTPPAAQLSDGREKTSEAEDYLQHLVHCIAAGEKVWEDPEYYEKWRRRRDGAA